MSRDMQRVPLARALTDAGFRRDGNSTDPLLYVMQVGDRLLDVQLWKDGRHRVSHAIVGELPGHPAREPFLGKHHSTPPTDFTTLGGMWAAVMAQMVQTGHKPSYGYRLGLGAATLLVAERRRQVEEEGWTPEHDDKHVLHQLPLAAACYALLAAGWALNAVAELWPTSWSRVWLRPKTPRRDLVKAGALIIAELERLDRAERRADDADWSATRSS